MKDSLLELLINFFEKSLSRLKESQQIDNSAPHNPLDSLENFSITLTNEALFIKAVPDTAMRIFTPDEQRKFTKASYQFLCRLIYWGILAPEAVEMVINQLIFSESPFVNLQETKWTIRNVLAENLDAAQLAFLDLVLYQKEDELSLH